MSIIYDALKKAQKTINLAPKIQVDTKDRPSKSGLKLYLLYALVVCLGLFAGNTFFSFLTSPQKPALGLLKPLPVTKSAYVEPRPAQMETAQPKAPAVSSVSRYNKNEEKDSLVLNGVFFSQDEGYALINNHIVKVGDVVGGATVKQITPDEVELEVSGSVVKLSTRIR